MRKNNVSRSLPLFLSMMAALATAGACSNRARLSASHGRAYHAAFGTQPANPQAGAKAKKLPGLDAQEARIVADNYARSLRVKDTQREDPGLILMAPPAPPTAQQQPYLPPPSVPERR